MTFFSDISACESIMKYKAQTDFEEFLKTEHSEQTICFLFDKIIIFCK